MVASCWLLSNIINLYVRMGRHQFYFYCNLILSFIKAAEISAEDKETKTDAADQASEGEKHSKAVEEQPLSQQSASTVEQTAEKQTCIDQQTGATSVKNVSRGSEEITRSNKHATTEMENDTSLANDILAAAFNTALTSEISIDNLSISHLISGNNSQLGSSFGSRSTVKEPDLICDEKKKTGNTDADKCEEVKGTVSEVSDTSNSLPFSPFSPFGQEIQSIMGATCKTSPILTQTTTVNASKGVRRITPIPIKGCAHFETSSSFQTAMANSPVLPDVPVVYSPHSREERSSSQPGQTQSNSSSTDNPPTFSGTLKNVDSDSGSGSKTGTQVSESNSLKDTDNSQSLDLPVSISICQPEIHCEDANVSFPKLPTTTQSSVILSEESLFHCFSKTPHLSDTLHSVSNLSNILNALDGKHPGVETDEHQSGNDYTEENIAIKDDKESTASLNVLNKELTEKDFERTMNIKDPVLSEKEKEPTVVSTEIQETARTPNVESECMRSLPANAVESNLFGSSSSDSDNSSEGSVSQSSTDNASSAYVPRTALSLENVKRLKTGLFQVSRLSDSDSSHDVTPVASKVIMVETSKISNESDNLVGKRKACDDTSATKKMKMSRRELRKSIQCANKDQSVIYPSELDADETRSKTNEDSCDVQSVHIKKEPDTDTTEDQSVSDPVQMPDGQTSEDVIEQQEMVSEAVTVKTETETVSESDSLSHGRKKSKHKKHRSGKEHKEHKKRKHRDREAGEPVEKRAKCRPDEVEQVWSLCSVNALLSFYVLSFKLDIQENE